MKTKAFAKLIVKALDDEQRIITGVASTPSADRHGDTIEMSGAGYADDIPFLWQHAHDKPIGRAQLGKATKDGIPFTAKIAKIAEDGQLKELCDYAWQSIKAGLVRGVSIGFNASGYEPRKGGGLHFTDIEIFELSAVTIPANAEATIQTIKALHGENKQAVRLVTPKKTSDNHAIKLIGR